MQRLGNRILLLMALSVLAVPIGAVGVAYACTALATVSTIPGTAVAGKPVTVTGKYFAPHDASDVRTSPAVVRMDTVDGPVLGTASPSPSSSGGAFSVSVTVPATASAGDHVLIVTQNDISGRPAYGTPARTVLKVVQPPAVADAVAPAAPTAIIAPVIAPLPAVTVPAKPSGLTRAQRMARCKAKFKVSSAKTQRGRKRIAARRASCIRAASRSTSSR